MNRKYLIPLLSLLGLVFALLTVFQDRRTPASVPPAPATQSPYPAAIAGSGIVEASSENVALGAQLPGIVSRIYVHIGSDVKAGDPLFTVDEAATRAEVARRRAAVQVAEADVADASYELKLTELTTARSITSVEERERKRFTKQKADAQLSQARAELQASETDLSRLTVRAPVDGQVLQLKVHLGEYAPVTPATAGQQPLILLGSVTPLHVRVDIDENDAWRVRAGAAATGYLRSNQDIHLPLTFVRFEPYVVPKRSLTGQSTERIDTRVLQVIFSFDRGDRPLFVGQQMDVFIQG